MVSVEMTWMDMLKEIFTVVILPLLGILTAYLTKYIQTKKDELKVKTENEKLHNYLDMLADVVTDCVLTTTQTYVEALKKDKVFDKDAQKEAFEKTRTAVLTILSQDAQEFLQTAIGDFDAYLTALIESSVHLSK